MKKLVSLMLVLTLVIAMAAPAAMAAPTELIMYLVSDRPVGFDDALAEFNKLAEEELGVTLTVNFITWGEFDTSYPLLLASGEVFDLVYCAGWANYTDYALKGSFLPLEDLLEENMPATCAALPQEAWDDVTVNGHIYAVPSNAAAPQTTGCNVRGDLMTAYGMESIESVDDLVTYLTNVAEKNPEITYPLTYPDTLYYIMLSEKYDIHTMGTNGIFAYRGDDYENLFMVYDCDEFKECVKTIADLTEKGLWSRSVLSITDDEQVLFSQGATACRIHNIDSWLSIYQACPAEWDVRWYRLASDPHSPGYLQDVMCVPYTSQHPAEALKLLDAIRTDSRYYDKLVYGVEGKDYNLDENGYVEMISDFDSEAGTWGMATMDVKRLYNGAPSNYVDVLQEIIDNYSDYALSGFNLDLTTNFSSEQAMIANAASEYLVPLKSGVAADVDTAIAEMQKQGEVCGDDAMLEEATNQIKAFLAAK